MPFLITAEAPLTSHHWFSLRFDIPRLTVLPPSSLYRRIRARCDVPSSCIRAVTDQMPFFHAAVTLPRATFSVLPRSHLIRLDPSRFAGVVAHLVIRFRASATSTTVRSSTGLDLDSATKVRIVDHYRSLHVQDKTFSLLHPRAPRTLPRAAAVDCARRCVLYRVSPLSPGRLRRVRRRSYSTCH